MSKKNISTKNRYNQKNRNISKFYETSRAQSSNPMTHCIVRFKAWKKSWAQKKCPHTDQLRQARAHRLTVLMWQGESWGKQKLPETWSWSRRSEICHIPRVIKKSFFDASVHAPTLCTLCPEMSKGPKITENRLISPWRVKHSAYLTTNSVGWAQNLSSPSPYLVLTYVYRIALWCEKSRQNESGMIPAEIFTFFAGKYHLSLFSYVTSHLGCNIKQKNLVLTTWTRGSIRWWGTDPCFPGKQFNATT